MYLVCSDLDGTLITEKKHIRLLSRFYFRKFIKRGNIFVINTGRTYSGCYKIAKEIKGKYPIICNNGLEIYIPEGNTYKRIAYTFKYEPFLEFLSKVDSYIVCGIETTDMHINLQERCHVPWWLIHDEHPDIKVYEGKLLNLINEDIVSATIWVNEENKDEVLRIANRYKDCFETIYHGTWDYSSIQFIPVGKSKGTALKYIEDYYQVPHENVYAFGDEKNDCMMLSEAFHGIAMINGKCETKKIADDVTEYDNEHNGVARYLIKHNVK